MRSELKNDLDGYIVVADLAHKGNSFGSGVLQHHQFRSAFLQEVALGLNE